jgi:cytochrome P450
MQRIEQATQGADVNDSKQPDWDPRSETVARDPRAAYDDLRERCPVAWNDLLGWTLFRHRDIRRVLEDVDGFSNVVSRHPAVPNGMDPPEHTGFRQLIEPYFDPVALDTLAPQLGQIATGLARQLSAEGNVDMIGEFCEPFAVRAQCAFLGWPESLERRLAAWNRRSREATRRQHRPTLTDIAAEFETLVKELLEQRRAAGPDAPEDNTTRLMRERVNGRPLRDEEIVSILRNWTVGEVGTLAASLGIILHFLAERPQVQSDLRRWPARIPDAVEEILRLHGPLLANRRVAAADTEIGGRRIAAGERVTVLWVAANRDTEAFPNARDYRPERDQSANLLWGAGIHVCPGAPLARLELRIALQSLLAATGSIEPAANAVPDPAVYPASGFATLPVRITRTGD